MRKKVGIVCIVLGALMVLAAAGLALYNYIEAEYAAKAADDALVEVKEAIGRSDAETGGYEYIGYLSIPTLELELPVMAEWDYTRLNISPCRYSGSPETNDLVIAGHNYTRHFGRLSQLKAGDAVLFTDMEGTVYTYRVADMETLPPTAVEEMIDSGYDLTLYTCTYSGQARVTVRCDRADG